MKRQGTRLALAGAVLLALVVLAVWVGGDAVPPTPASTGSARPDAQSAPSAAAASDAVAVREPEDAFAARTVVTSKETTGAPGVGDHPYEFAVDIEVVDGLGLPVAGQTVLLAPVGLDLHRCEHQTDHNGRVALRWRAHRGSMLMAFGLAKAQECEVVQVQHGATRHVVLGTGQLERPAWPQRASDPGGRFAAMLVRAEVARQLGGQLAGQSGTVVSLRDSMRPRPRAVRPHLPEPRLAKLGPLHPFARFSDVGRRRRLDEPPAPIDDIAIAGLLVSIQPDILSRQRLQLATSLALAAQQVRVTNDAVVNDQILVQFTTMLASRGMGQVAPAGSLSGTVHTETGEPACGEIVAWRLGLDQPWQRATTDAEGHFEVRSLGSGTATVRAGGDRRGLALQTCELLPGVTQCVDLTLRRGSTVRGRAVGADDAPLQGHVVEWHGADLAEHDVCPVDADGRFELPNRSGGPGRLWLRQSGLPPDAVTSLVYPDAGDVVLRPEANSGSLSLQLVLPPGCEEFAVRALVWDAATGLGVRIGADAQGILDLSALRRGTYRVLLLVDSLGAVDLGSHWVDGSGCTDLGRVRLPAPGDVEFERGGSVAADRTEELHRLGPDVDVRIDGFTKGTRHLTLAAGTYLWSWRDGGDAAGSQAFAVRAGATTAARR